MEYFLGKIEHLVCCKVCSNSFEIQLTNKKVPMKNIFEEIFSWKGGKYFDAKNLNFEYFIMIA